MQRSQQLKYNKTSNKIQPFCILLLDMKETLGQLVSRRIRELQMSQSELARKTGFTRGYINNIVNEKAANTSGQYNFPPETVEKFARALRVTNEEILASMGYLNPQIDSNNLSGKPGKQPEDIMRDIGFNLFGGFSRLSEQQQIEFMKELRIIGEGILESRRLREPINTDGQPDEVSDDEILIDNDED